MLFIESTSVDPHFNLALEQYVFDYMDRDHEYFMLWQNDKSVIVGKHQNTIAEINQAYVTENNISVVRRLSGGGAVYHDLGNVNYTFIVDAAKEKSYDFSAFCSPIIRALAKIGVIAEATGRNDMTVGGKKFSGNAQYIRQSRIMHHGTIMFDCDLDAMHHALAAPKDVVDSKGIRSRQSSVTNIKPHMSADISVKEFIGALRDFFIAEYGLQTYNITFNDMENIGKIRSDVYDTWDWNYGHSPPYSIVKERRVEGCGNIQIHMNVEGGLISEIAFYGDYFGCDDTQELKRRLSWCRIEEGELRKALAGVGIGQCFHQMDMDIFISTLLQ